MVLPELKPGIILGKNNCSSSYSYNDFLYPKYEAQLVFYILATIEMKF